MLSRRARLLETCDLWNSAAFLRVVDQHDAVNVHLHLQP